MRQQSIDLQNEFQTAAVPAQEPFFDDEQTVQSIPAVIPLDETATKASARFRPRRVRVPRMRKEDKSFNPAFLIMAFIAVTALGVIAGTLLYQASAERSANNASAIDTDEPANRTIPAKYQFVVDQPESSSSSSTTPAETRDSFTALPSSPSAAVSEPAGNNSSRNNQQSGASSEQQQQEQSDGENEEQPAQNDESGKQQEQPAAITPSRNEDDEDIPPPPPMRRERRDGNKQDKTKQKNNNSEQPQQPENRENEQPATDSGESGN